MNRTKILLIGDSPHCFSGNAHMCAELINQIDKEKYQVNVFAIKNGSYNIPDEPIKDVRMIEGTDTMGDMFCSANLIQLLASMKDLNIVIFVGLDMWRYREIFPLLIRLKKENKFKWASIFPYDLTYLKKDWLEYLAPVDFPCVYSQYGYDILKDHVKNLRYFRPPLNHATSFKKYPSEIRKSLREQLFGIKNDEQFMFGMFGLNQHRKDPQRFIYTFSKLIHENTLKKKPSIYLHTEVNEGPFLLQSFINDMGVRTGDVFLKKQGFLYPTDALVDIYNCMDAYVSVSLQEGLNWTMVEALLCGLPIIGSYNTAHIELLRKTNQFKINCTDLSYVPIQGEWLPSYGCNVTALQESMECIVNASNEEIKMLSEDSLENGKKWIEGVSDINVLIEDIIDVKVSELKRKNNKINKILFVQHSSAGDVLMSTQCFKGIKQRHTGKQLVYMTQPQYRDIVVDNPYIDEIIDYDENVIDEYEFVYNPHGDKILPGGWNNLDVTLHSMYPYFCKVTADDLFIQEKEPDKEIVDELEKLGDYVVVHTSGASDYRRYPHMDFVIQQLKMNAVQIGGKYDVPCLKASLDLRDRISFREAAWVMKRAKVAIVIDSYPAHLAGAIGTPVVVLFGPAPARVTRPKADETKLVCLGPEMLSVCGVLSHCWGNPPEGKKSCDSPCISTIHPLQIVKAARSLLK